MSFYSDDIVDDVLAANDIVDVVSSYVKLEKKGKYFFGLCPFHREKSASFSVTPSKQMYYCYSCSKGGSAIHFIMAVENLSFVESLKLLAEKARITLPENSNKQDEERIKLKKDIININTEAARYFHKVLMDKEGEEAREYLKKRMLSENIITKFGVGFSPKKGDSLCKHIESFGYEAETLKKCGLFLENNKNQLFDRFRGRIMFPIFDIRGSVIAFGGRVMDDSLPKYMNSPETAVYSKGRNLYALNFVRKTGDKKLIIVEGYMDVISLHQNSIINAVASLGTALTEEQGRLLRMYGEEIIISYDADIAGQNATLKGLDILDELGCSVKVLKVPKGKDPDEFIKSQGADSFIKLVGKSLTLLEYKVSLLKEQHDLTSTVGKIDFLNKTAEVLSKIDNNIEREMYIKKLSRDYEIREDSLESEISKKKNVNNKKTKVNAFENRNSNSNNNSITKNGDGGGKAVIFEKILIALLTIENSIYKSVEQELTPQLFTGEIERELAELVLKKIKTGKGITVPELLSNLDEEQVGEYVRIIDKECVFEDNVKAFKDIQKKLEFERLSIRQQEILDLLKRNDIKDEVYLDQLKNEFKELSFILSQKKNF